MFLSKRIRCAFCLILAVMLIASYGGPGLVLAEGSTSIAGIVYQPDGTSPYDQGSTYPVDVNLKSVGSPETIVLTTTVDSDGSYTLSGDVPTGDYTLGAEIRVDNPLASSLPISLHIETGTSITQNISLTNPVISGSVLKPDGTPFFNGPDSGVDVVLRKLNDGRDFAHANVNSDGTYKLGGDIPSDDYMLYAYAYGNSNSYSNSAPLFVYIDAGVPKTIDVSLTNPIVTGTVFKPDGTPFQQGQDSWIYLELRTSEPDSDWIADTGVTDSGSFKLGGNIPAGDYILYASAGGKSNPYASAMPVSVHVDAGNVTIQNIALTNPTISGSILKPDGTPFSSGPDSGVNVVLKKINDGKDFVRSNANDDGTYRLGGNIPSGDYMLYAFVYWSSNPYSDSIPLFVHVDEGIPLTMDVSLTTPIVTGTVFKPDGTPFQQGQHSWVNVELRDPNNNYVIGTGVNNDSGIFNLGGNIPTGDYVLNASADGKNNPFANAIPVSVHVDAGNVTVQNITLTNPVISGIVLKPDGTPFLTGFDSGVSVVLKKTSDGKDFANYNVNTDGTYKFGGDISSDDYMLYAYAYGSNNPYSNSVPLFVHIDLGVPKSIDVSLTNPVVTGTVFKPDGTPFQQGPDSWISLELRTADPENNWVSDTGVNDDGSYKLGGNVPTGDYKLYAHADGKNNPYADAEPISIHVEAGIPVIMDVDLTNSLFTGRVLKPDGTVFMPGFDSWAHIGLDRVNDGQRIADADVDENGNFKFRSAIPTGDYRLNVSADGNANPYANALPIEVHIDAGIPKTMDVSLANPVVTGTVLKPDGTPFQQGQEYWTHLELRTSGPENNYVADAGVDDNGFFKLGGNIPTGDYILYASADGKNNPFANAIPVSVHVDAGNVTVQNITLTNPVISGIVLKPDGTPFLTGFDSGVSVVLKKTSDGKDFANYNVNTDGTYKFGGDISSDDYMLYAYAYGSNNPYSNSVPLFVHIDSGVPKSIDVSLTNPVVTGTVFKPDGTPFQQGPDSWISLELRTADPENNWVSDTGVNDDGSYKLGGNVPTGDYKLYAHADGKNNPFAAAEPVSIHIEAGIPVIRDVDLTNPLFTGRVLKPDGTVFVPGFDSWSHLGLDRANDGQRIADADVDENGNFKFRSAIPTGDYRLNVSADGNANPYANALPIEVHIDAGIPKTMDVSLANPVVTGTVLKPDGTPFQQGQDSWVYLELRTSGPESNYVVNTNIKDGGIFKLGGNIPAGDYILYANADGKSNPYANAVPVSVHIDAGNATVQNITLTNAVISGIVLKPDGTPFQQGQDSWVYLELRTSGPENNYVANTNIKDGGFFKVGGNIPAGDYILYAHADGKNNPYADAEPISIHVEAGMPIIMDVSLTNSLFTGRVLRPDGTVFMPGFDSWAHIGLDRANDGQRIADADVDENGNFKFKSAIPTGDYRLNVTADGNANPYANALPIEVHVDAGILKTMDVSLTNPVVTGTVLKPDGTPFQQGQDSWVHLELRTSGPNSSYVADTGVNDSGFFKLGGNIPAGDYMLYANADGKNNPYTSAVPVSVHVNAGNVTIQDVTLTNAVISGMIRKPDGSVYMRGSDSWGSVVVRNSSNGNDVARGNLNDDGTYRIGGIPAGDYTINVEVWGNCPFTSPAPVNVYIDPATPMTLDLTLASTSISISGRILKPDGSVFAGGLGSASVYLRDVSFHANTFASAQVDANGSYTISGNFPAGDYNLYVEAFGASNPYANSGDIPVHVGTNAVLAKDLSLTNPSIQGTVVTPDSNPFIPGDQSNVVIWLLTTDEARYVLAYASVREDGTYKLQSTIPVGDYTLVAKADGTNNPYANSLYFPVHYDGNTLITKDLTLTAPAVVGRVYNFDGTEYGQGTESWVHINMDTIGQNSQRVADTALNMDGTFKLGQNIPAGDYILYSDAFGINNPNASAKPVTVHVNAGTTTHQDINLTQPLVAGRLLDPNGFPIIIPNGVWGRVALQAKNPNGTTFDIADGCANPDGSFKLGMDVPAGDYTLFGYTWGDNNPYDKSQPENIHIQAGAVVSKNLKLTWRGESAIMPQFILDRQNYNPGDMIDLGFKLTGTKPGNKTNSATFELEYDSNAFELETDNVNTDVLSGYLQFNTKADTASAPDKRKLILSYTSMNGDINLVENETLFKVHLKVKGNAIPGQKTLTLLPVSMADSSITVYNINNSNPKTCNIDVGVSSGTAIEGYVNIYLGDAGIGSYPQIISGLSQASINQAFGSLKLTLKQNPADPGTVFNGSDVFIPDTNGNLAALDANNRVTGKFRIGATGLSNAVLRIDDAGYLGRDFVLSVVPEQVSLINTYEDPVEMLPGDLARTASNTLELKQDGKITVIDFTAWQKVFMDFQAGTANQQDIAKADFTRNGIIDSTDYDLWLAAYNKALVHP